MTPYVSERILKALSELRRAEKMRRTGSTDAMKCEMNARVLLEVVLIVEGVDPEQHMTSDGEPV